MLRRLFLLSLVVTLVAGACTESDGAAAEETTSTDSGVATTTIAPTTTAATTPVSADEPLIDITFTDSGTTYVGDREIIEGTATITFSNETDNVTVAALLRYETGSAALAEELASLEEGNHAVPGDEPPTAGFEMINLEGSSVLAPGSHTWTVDLELGTYLFDVGPLDFHTTGLWRAAVLEVVGE